jgi:Domain of unknown function (DUF4149)
MKMAPVSLHVPAPEHERGGRARRPSWSSWRDAAIIAGVLWLRLASLLALGAWIGGLVVLGGLVAPAVFAVLEARDPVAGRTLAGLLVGTIFDRFQHVVWALGGLQLALLGARAAIGPRPWRFGLRMWTVTLMVAVSLGSGLVVGPRIDAIRAEVAGPVASLPDTDARKIAFGRLHALSSGLMLLTIAAGIGLFWAEVRDQKDQ